jgi:thioredoxin-related protein
VDVQSSAGADIARDFGTFTPTFVLFDAQGLELWRVIGSIDPDQVRQSMSSLGF